MRLIAMVTPMRCSFASSVYRLYDRFSIIASALARVCKSDNGIDEENTWTWEFAGGRRSFVLRVRDSARLAPGHWPRPEYHWSSTGATARWSIKRPRKFGRP